MTGRSKISQINGRNTSIVNKSQNPQEGALKERQILIKNEGFNS